MLKTALFHSFFFLFYLSTQAQTFSAQLKDSLGEPIPYVNIGVLNKNIGTVSNIQGFFTLPLQTAQATDTIRISAIGYKTLDFLVKDAQTHIKQGVIFIHEQNIILPTVVIKPKKPIFYTAGNKFNSIHTTANFTSNDLGNELGVLLKVRKKPSWIQKLHFNLAYNKLGKIKFRVNIYQMNGNQVGKNILTEPLYIETELSTGTLSIDLKDKYILLESDCMISLEWIADYGENKGNLGFCAGFLGSKMFYRKTSQGSWETLSGVSVGFYAELMHEK